MLEINILEGARGTGKSTLAFKLRQCIPQTTLINFTGFPTDGEEGFEKIRSYYINWIDLLHGLYNHDSKLIFDRFFFSEMVYSSLYKNYDFSIFYNKLLYHLDLLTGVGVKINIFHLTIHNEEELKQRLMRDKIPFGKAEESVKETLKQQQLYTELFDDLYETRAINNDNLNIYEIDTSGLTNDEVYEQIMQQLETTEK